MAAMTAMAVVGKPQVSHSVSRLMDFSASNQHHQIHPSLRVDILLARSVTVSGAASSASSPFEGGGKGKIFGVSCLKCILKKCSSQRNSAYIHSSTGDFESFS